MASLIHINLSLNVEMFLGQLIVLGGGSHTPDPDYCMTLRIRSALEEPIMNRYNTVIKQSPPYMRLAINQGM